MSVPQKQSTIESTNVDEQILILPEIRKKFWGISYFEKHARTQGDSVLGSGVAQTDRKLHHITK